LGGPFLLVGSRSPAPAARPSRSASRPFGCRSLPRSLVHAKISNNWGWVRGPCPWHDHPPSKNTIAPLSSLHSVTPLGVDSCAKGACRRKVAVTRDIAYGPDSARLRARDPDRGIPSEPSREFRRISRSSHWWHAAAHSR